VPRHFTTYLRLVLDDMLIRAPDRATAALADRLGQHLHRRLDGLSQFPRRHGGGTRGGTAEVVARLASSPEAVIATTRLI
jgi:hypothetical protein